MKQGKKATRRPKDKDEFAEYIKARLERIAEAIRKGMSFNDSARLAGVNPNTFYDWKAKAKKGQEPHAQMWAIIDKAELEGEESLLTDILASARNGDWRAAAWLLEKRKPRRYGKQEALTHTLMKQLEKDIAECDDNELLAEIKQLQDQIDSEE